MNQNLRLLSFLAAGHSITRLEAHITLRIQNVTARLVELRDRGWDIKTTVKVDANGARYADYRLADADEIALAKQAVARGSILRPRVEQPPMQTQPATFTEAPALAVMSFAAMTA